MPNIQFRFPSITALKTDLTEKANNRSFIRVQGPQVASAQALDIITRLQKIGAFLLAALATLFTGFDRNWKKATREVALQVYTGEVYTLSHLPQFPIAANRTPDSPSVSPSTRAEAFDLSDHPEELPASLFHRPASPPPSEIREVSIFTKAELSGEVLNIPSLTHGFAAAGSAISSSVMPLEVSVDLPPVVGTSVASSPTLSPPLAASPSLEAQGDTPLSLVERYLEPICKAASIRDEADKQKFRADLLSFLERKGKIEVVGDGACSGTLHLKGKDVIVGCTSGQNRSQMARAYLQHQGCHVKAVLAGGDSALAPDAEMHMGNLGFFTREEQELFQLATKARTGTSYSKVPQLGSEVPPESGFLARAENHQFYQNYFNALAPVHFVIFARSAPSLISRLLERPGDLEGFNITYLTWDDELAHVPDDVHPEIHEDLKTILVAYGVKAEHLTSWNTLIGYMVSDASQRLDPDARNAYKRYEKEWRVLAYQAFFDKLARALPVTE